MNVFEYEEQARLAVGAAKTAPAAGSDRTVTDRITLRPRINIPTLRSGLTANLFGDQHFTPIIVGPMADQKRFHPEGEIATARGASAAKAAMVVSSDFSTPLAAIAQTLTTPLWLQVYANSPKIKDRLAEASAAKAKAVIVTVNAGASANAPATPELAHIDWAAVDAVVKNTHLPVIVKGITHPQDAKEAVARGARAWWCRTIAAATRRRLKARCCWSRRWYRRWAARCRCWSMAASATARTFSKPWPLAPKEC